MADFEQVAQNIVNDFSFRLDTFWQSYKSPVLPSFRAMQILAFGPDLLYWRVSLLVLTLAGVLWLFRELRLVTHSNLLGLILLFTVALSKSSIFWSYKLSTEGLSEALLYLSLAAAFFTWRRPVRGALPLAIILTLATLNRPNAILSLGFFPLLLAIKWYLSSQKPAPRVLLCTLSLYVIGISAIWAPWLYRSYTLYGHVVPFNTAGPTSFIYGVWQVPVQQDDGTTKEMTWQQMMEAGPKKFESDYTFYIWARAIVAEWLKNNWRTMPALIATRLESGIRDRDVQLTRVSRINLFAEPLNTILVDKEYPLILSGTAGLILLPIVAGVTLILIPALSIHIWVISAFFQANPRFIEPVIPLLLFGNVSYLLIALRICPRIMDLKAFFNHKEVTLSIALLSVLSLGAGGIFALVVRPVDRPAGCTVINSDFEQVTSHNRGLVPIGWELGGSGQGQMRADNSRVHTGSYSVEVTVTEGSKALYQDLQTSDQVADRTFSISVFVRTLKPNTTYLALSDGVRWFYSKRNAASHAWESLQLTGRLSSNPRSLRLHLYVENDTASIDTLHIGH